MFVLLFTFGETFLIGFNKMLGEMAHGEHHHSEQYWESKAHHPPWKARANNLHVKRNSKEMQLVVRAIKSWFVQYYLPLI